MADETVGQASSLTGETGPKYATADEVQRIVSAALAKQEKAHRDWLSEALKEDTEPAADGEAETTDSAPPEAKTDAEKKLLAQLQRSEREGAKLAKRMAKLETDAAETTRRAEERERHAAIRSELGALAVTKPDAAFKIVRDDIYRGEDGKLYAKNAEGDEVPLKEHVAGWLKGFPEFQPPRTAGGSGAVGQASSLSPPGGAITLDDIRPGMKPEEKQRVYRRIAELASEK